jgi:hypothetical protein
METNNPKVNTTPALNTSYLHTGVTSIPPLLQLLGQVAAQQYETKAHANNQVKVQPASY